VVFHKRILRSVYRTSDPDLVRIRVRVS